MGEDGRILVYSVIGFGAGLFFFFSAFRNWKLLRLIKNIPTSKVRSIAMGLVELCGKARAVPAGLLTSPFTSTDCVWYRYTIEEHRSSGKSSRWVTLRNWASNSHFYLEDDTGKVLVDPLGATIDVPLSKELKSGSFKDPPAEVKSFLEAQNLAFEGFLGVNKSMRYREWLIAPNQQVYILGTAGKNPYVKEGTAQHSAENIMIQKGKNEKFFNIAEKDEQTIISKVRSKVLLGLWGGGALAIACLAIIFLYLGIF